MLWWSTFTTKQTIIIQHILQISTIKQNLTVELLEQQNTPLVKVVYIVTVTLLKACHTITPASGMTTESYTPPPLNWSDPLKSEMDAFKLEGSIRILCSQEKQTQKKQNISFLLWFLTFTYNILQIQTSLSVYRHLSRIYSLPDIYHSLDCSHTLDLLKTLPQASYIWNFYT